MTENFLHNARVDLVFEEHCRECVPLWYNNAKSKKPVKSMLCGFGVTFFHPILNPKRADLAP
ncbi:MAG: hypothetical protein LBN42_02665, partial [Oscillospiraceae bacterium]|nr:hypothetical protein [Oscillospiraceae bacterium]